MPWSRVPSTPQSWMTLRRTVTLFASQPVGSCPMMMQDLPIRSLVISFPWMSVFSPRRYIVSTGPAQEPSIFRFLIVTLSAESLTSISPQIVAVVPGADWRATPAVVIGTSCVNDPSRQPTWRAERPFTKVLTLPEVSVWLQAGDGRLGGGGVAACTTAVAADAADVEPPVLVAVTVATILDPTSAVA